MPRSLTLKLIVALTIIVALVEGISGYINAKHQEREMLNAMILGADQLSRSITSATWHAMLADNRETAYEVMQTIAHKQGIERIRIFNKEGLVMFTTDPDEPKQVDKDAEACALCHASFETLVKVDVPTRARIFRGQGDERKLAMVTPIYNEAACSNAACHAHPSDVNVLGVLDVAFDLSEVDHDVKENQIRAGLVTALHILLIGTFIAFFTQYFVKIPISQLIEATRSVSAMQLDKPIKIRSGEEINQLARSFEIMRLRLRKAMGRINRFTRNLETKVEQRTKELQTAHQKLLRSDRLASLGQLAASVAHEINNPLSGVLNLSMLMQRLIKENGIPPERIPEFRKYLSQVTNETARVGRIVSDLLAFSRQSKPNSTRADLNEIVRTTLSLLSHKLKLSNVNVETDLQDQLPPVRCDSSQMQQVVINLVMNGAEATHIHNAGKVSISTRANHQENTAVLEIHDNGEGISAEHLARIYDPFFTTKEEGKGVGLGLSVVYGIIEAHGGDIDVMSRVGEGTTFVIRLPLIEKENGQTLMEPMRAGQAG